jgi:hypothetical protein
MQRCLQIWIACAMWLLGAAVVSGEQIAVSRIEQMPNIPGDFSVIDWNLRARNLDAFLFDATTTGTFRPVIYTDNSKTNINRAMFGMPSYIGSATQRGTTSHESITCMGATLGASLAGINKANQAGRNYVLDAEGYYNTANGENLVLNLTSTRSGGSFWYELMPHIFFYSLASLYPGQGQMETIMRDTANKWWLASYQMGGSTGTPNYDHTAFRFQTLVPVDNGRWKEPDASAAIAWLGYMAYQKSNQASHLQLANWGMQFLENRPADQNPYYESLLPYGTYLAARMNAEQGTHYNIDKFVNWCFEPSQARPSWCVLLGSWNGYDVDGLSGSSTDGGGYAFAMNTFNQALSLVPMVRYDERYARAIGKWMLNAASNARHFYRDQMPSNLQSSAFYTESGADAVAYEGFRKAARRRATNLIDYQTAAGTITAGSAASLQLIDGVSEVLRETSTGSYDQLEHIWRVTLQDNNSQSLYVTGNAVDGGDGDAGFQFSWSKNASGPWTNMFTVTGYDQYGWGLSGVGGGGDLYIRVVDTNRAGGNTSLDQLNLEVLTVVCDLPSITPYAMGDPLPFGWGQTDLGIYGSALCGVFGGIIGRTNNDYILKLDCLKTDMFRKAAYPTYLLYNPHGTFAWVQVDVGATPVDLYDAVANRFMARNKTGLTTFAVEADSAALLVLTPAGKPYSFDGSKLMIDGIIADYHGDANFLNACDPQWAIYN